MEDNLVFPDLIYFEDYQGDFRAYFTAVYKVFEQNFIRTQPKYLNVRISVKKFPEVDGIHRTFYHITHEGKDENDRQPDFRRMERIRFPKFMIDNNPHEEILIWKNKRGTDERILLYNEGEQFVVVLAERKGFYLFVTAYYIERQHRRDKLMKEYAAYIKAKTA